MADDTESTNPFGMDEQRYADFALTAIKSVFASYFTPEIERRRASGEIGDNFELIMAQAIFPESGNNRIRLNEEVKGVMLVRAPRPVEPGDPVMLSDLQDFHAFELSDDEVDCGHITVFQRGTGWMLTFNALAGRKKAANAVRLANEFYDAANFCFQKHTAGPCIDNLFSCCELLAKAELIMHRSEAARGKSHKPVSSAINLWGKLGNVSPDFVKLMNRLSSQRGAARYQGAISPDDMPSQADFDVVSIYMARLCDLSSSKVDLGEASASPKKPTS